MLDIWTKTDSYISLDVAKRNSNSKWKNIYPEEIEGLLQNIPEIKEVMVYGKNQLQKTIKEK